MSGNESICTACGAAVPANADGRLPAQCPACGQFLVIDDEPSDAAAPAEAPETEELEELKIRRIIRDRRAMVRTRGYQIVVLLACVVGATQLAVRLGRSGKSTEMIGYAAALILIGLIAWNVVGRFRRTSAAISGSALKEPETPPDFSGLSDGSQHAENLKQIGRPEKQNGR